MSRFVKTKIKIEKEIDLYLRENYKMIEIYPKYYIKDGYEASISYVKIICDKNHIFNKKYNDFKKSNYCPKCSKKESFNKRNDERIKKYICEIDKVKGDYKVENVRYVEFDTYTSPKIDVTCPKGHKFTTSYFSFVYGKTRCATCHNKNNSEKLSLSEEEIKNNLIKKFGEKFKLENIFREKNKIFISYTYDNNKIDKQRYDYLMTKESLFHNKKEDKIKNIRKIMENKYHDYSFNFVLNKNNSVTMHYVCPKGRKSKTKFKNEYFENFCCNKKCCKSYEKYFYKKIKELKEMENSYDFRNPFFNDKGKLFVEVTCNNNHNYTTTFYSFKEGYRCSTCKNHRSKAEFEIIEFIKSNFNIEIIHGDRKTIKSLYNNSFMELDVLLPEIKFAIEFNGIYWHNDKNMPTRSRWKSFKEKHEHKTNECAKKGIELLHIDEYDWEKNKEKILKCIYDKINDKIHYNNE